MPTAKRINISLTPEERRRTWAITPRYQVPIHSPATRDWIATQAAQEGRTQPNFLEQIIEQARQQATRDGKALSEYLKGHGPGMGKTDGYQMSPTTKKGA